MPYPTLATCVFEPPAPSGLCMIPRRRAVATSENPNANLFRRGGAMFAFANVFHFFADAFARLG